LVLAATLTAQSTLYVPDNNAASGLTNYFPFSTTGQWGPNWRFQCLILSTYLLPKVFNITDVSFAPSTTTTFTAHQFQMRMANTTYSNLTTSTCFDQVLGSSPATVYNGPITYPLIQDTWSPLGLQSSFLYDGKSNLVIEIRYVSQSTTLNGPTHQGSFRRSWTNGWNSNPDPYNSTCPEFAGATGPKVCFTYNEILITLGGSPGPGGTVDLDLFCATDAGRFYQAASSLGTGPIPLGSRMLYLSPDDLLVITVNNYLPSIFVNYTGKLDAAGKAKAQIKIPNDTRLKGVRIHSAFVTLDASAPHGVSRISNTATFTIL
jgi:hypothetical protein